MSEIFFKHRADTSGSGYRRVRMCTAFGAILFSCVSYVASAVPLPANIYGTVSFNYLSPPPIDVRTFGPQALSGPSGDLLLDSGLTPSPFLFASGTIAEYFFGRSVGVLRYDVEIVGPDPTVDVQVTASGSVQGTSTVGGDPFAGFAMRSLWWLEDAFAGGQIFSDGIETPALTGSFSDSFTRTAALTLFTNRTYRVNMIADIGVRGGSAFAFIDPVFAFAPGVGSAFSFVFSDGVGNIGNSPNPDPNPNPAPVPEPGSLALIGAGLLLIALFRKRAMRKIAASFEPSLGISS